MLKIKLKLGKCAWKHCVYITRTKYNVSDVIKNTLQSSLHETILIVY